MRTKNLPIAEPVDPDPPTLPKFLEIGERLLKIRGVTKITKPLVQGRLNL